MNKKVKRIFEGLLFILIIGAFIYIGSLDFSKETTADKEKFDQEYKMVKSDNVFVYRNVQEINATLKNGTGIIFMGFPENIWSGYYANILNETAKQLGIKEILYYNFYEDRKSKNATYQSLVLKLDKYLPTLDDGTKNIYAPTLIIVKNGEIIAFDSETSFSTGSISPEEYWDSFQTSAKVTSFERYFKEYLSEVQ